jgi:6-phosphogluconolactonase
MALLTIVDDELALAGAAAARIAASIEAAIAARGAATWCLTGGETPEQMYRALADPARPWRTRIDWTRVHAYWGDERHVPPDHPDSNYGMAARALLDHVPIPATHVHRMRGEVPDAGEAAREYQRGLPEIFDVMLLGLGEDAHIASIFPGRPVPGGVRVAGVFAPHLNAWRITLTPPAILAARDIVMLVAGAAKAEAVYLALEGDEDPLRYPAQRLRPAGDRVEWFLDRAAAARLRGAPPA